MSPLLAQLENIDAHGGSYTERIVEHVIPCIGALVAAQHSGSLIKNINREILLKTRNSNNEVKYAALLAISELYTRLGEEMLAYFPEAIPFFAELFEDSDDNIESMCKEVCEQIQEFLGEPIEGYFT